MQILTLLLSILLSTPSNAQILEYGTCGLKPTEHFVALGYDDRYIIYETFVQTLAGQELFTVEIGQVYYNDYFLVGKYDVIVNTNDCSIAETVSLL